MMKYISLLACTMLSIGLSAQVVINVQLPASSLYLKNQLWNLSLVNAGSDEPNVRVEVLMTDGSTNQPVLSGVTGLLSIKRGVTQVNSTTASPIIYNVLNAGYNIDANPMGFLPIGIFNVCYRLIAVGKDSEVMTEECELIEIEPLSPPILIFPFDEDSIQTRRPLFTWLGPSSQGFMNNPSYDLNVVEVMPSQNPGNAIQQNVPVYFQSNIPFTAQAYPSSYPELDTAKLYAWQITAKNYNNTVARSEIWTFRVRNEITDETIVSGGVFYSKLRTTNDAAFTIARDKLNFEYTNELNESSVRLRIFDISNSRKRISLDTDTAQIHFGQNLIQYDLQEIGTFIHKHIYLLEVVNRRNETWYLKFEYRQPE